MILVIAGSSGERDEDVAPALRDAARYRDYSIVESAFSNVLFDTGDVFGN